MAADFTGWAYTANSHKLHWFVAGRRSLCKSYSTANARPGGYTPTAPREGECCKTCWRARARQVSRAANSG